MANGGQVEIFVVSTCREHLAIAQSRCLGLTGTNIHIYIHTYIQTGEDYALRLLVSRFGSEMMSHHIGHRTGGSLGMRLLNASWQMQVLCTVYLETVVQTVFLVTLSQTAARTMMILPLDSFI